MCTSKPQSLIYPVKSSLLRTPSRSLHSCVAFFLQAAADLLSATDWVILSQAVISQSSSQISPHFLLLIKAQPPKKGEKTWKLSKQWPTKLLHLWFDAAFMHGHTVHVLLIQTIKCFQDPCTMVCDKKREACIRSAFLFTGVHSIPNTHKHCRPRNSRNATYKHTLH